MRSCPPDRRALEKRTPRHGPGQSEITVRIGAHCPDSGPDPPLPPLGSSQTRALAVPKPLEPRQDKPCTLNSQLPRRRGNFRKSPSGTQGMDCFLSCQVPEQPAPRYVGCRKLTPAMWVIELLRSCSGDLAPELATWKEEPILLGGGGPGIRAEASIYIY